MTIEHVTPSCERCTVRCGLRLERLVLVEKSVELSSRNLMSVVTKVYGFPLIILLVVLFFESVVFSIGSPGLLFILLAVLPASIFLMTRWAREDILRKTEN